MFVKLGGTLWYTTSEVTTLCTYIQIYKPEHLCKLAVVPKIWFFFLPFFFFGYQNRIKPILRWAIERATCRHSLQSNYCQVQCLQYLHRNFWCTKELGFRGQKRKREASSFLSCATRISSPGWTKCSGKACTRLLAPLFLKLLPWTSHRAAFQDYFISCVFHRMKQVAVTQVLLKYFCVTIGQALTIVLHCINLGRIWTTTLVVCFSWNQFINFHFAVEMFRLFQTRFSLRF